MPSDYQHALEARGFFRRQGFKMLRGPLVVLVPGIFAAKAIEHAHKALKKTITELAPVAPHVAIDVTLTIAILGLILGGAWLLSWYVSQTRLGQRLLDWERVRFRHRSPILSKHLGGDEDESTDRAEDAQPVLARIEGTWRPGVIVEETPEGWATLPDVPSVGSGRLCCVGDDELEAPGRPPLGVPRAVERERPRHRRRARPPRSEVTTRTKEPREIS